MEVLLLLDVLEDIIDKASNLPLSSKIVLNKEEIIDIIRDVRIKLPDELKQAQWIKEERQKILIEAKKEAENTRKECDDKLEKLKEERQRILAGAEKEAEIFMQEADEKIKNMVDEHEISKRASEQAREIVVSAQQDAKKIRLGARAYADEMLAELETRLKKILTIINSNRDELKNHKS